MHRYIDVASELLLIVKLIATHWMWSSLIALMRCDNFGASANRATNITTNNSRDLPITYDLTNAIAYNKR
jgi:hypothetical protein